MEFSAFFSVIAISMIASSISVNSALPMADDPAAHGPKSVLNPRSPLAASINVGTTKNSPMGYMDSTPLQPIQVEQSNSACLVSQFLESVDEDMPPSKTLEDRKKEKEIEGQTE
ncbi:hypothetical protein RRG08_014328 [Elysia crispata]|uniref:Uncharacterized protein n=1 Tax=Elysia crispata TaxID=231223 RepID=A0AAE0Z0B4_9GAST|nr:hypothetical protein RRG08_014328 [Elysia crispata]